MADASLFQKRLADTDFPVRALRRLPSTVVTVAHLCQLPGWPEGMEGYEERGVAWLSQHGLSLGMTEEEIAAHENPRPEPPALPATGEPKSFFAAISDKEFAEVQTLLAAAQILCERRGLYPDTGTVTNEVLSEAANYFPLDSAEHKAIHVLAYAALVEIPIGDPFNASEVAAAIGLLMELFVRRKVLTQ